MQTAGEGRSIGEGGAASPPVGGTGGPRVGLSAVGKIDLCRGLFAWLVVVCHSFTMAYTVHPDAARLLSPREFAILDHTVGAGFVWVMGFFVISGYCIHQSVARLMAGPGFSLRDYLVARMTRILPLYFAALAFAVAVEPWIWTTRVGTPYGGLDATGLVAQVFLVQTLVHCFGSFTPSWSLTNEAFYYVLYGVLAASSAGRKARPFAIGLALCVALGGAFQAAYLAGFRSPFVLRVGLLFGLGLNWFLGVGVAVGRDRLRRSPAALAVARAWPLVLAASFAGYHWGLTIQFAYLCSGVAFALLLIRIVAVPEPEGGVAEPPWASRLVRFAGLTSYPTYLFHFTLMWFLATVIRRQDPSGSWQEMWGVLAVTSLILGAALGWYAERPVMRWRAGVLARGGVRRDRPRLPAEFGAARLGKESA